MRQIQNTRKLKNWCTSVETATALMKAIVEVEKESAPSFAFFKLIQEIQEVLDEQETQTGAKRIAR